jgi:subtilisin family serine protease
VRLDSAAVGLPVTPEDIVAAVSRPGTASELVARLQHPTGARFLIRDRMSVERRAKLLRIDAPEAKLQEYVVLVWPTRLDRERAQAVLRRDPLVLNAAENLRFKTSVAPLDPLYPYQSAWRWHETPSGWGAGWTPATAADQALNTSLESAWDWVHGSAYVAVLDTGIQQRGADGQSMHPDLAWLFRPHFSQDVFLNMRGEVDELNGLLPGTDPSSVYVGHGSHVAGILAAFTRRPGIPYVNPPVYLNQGPGVGVAGTCWFCNLMVQKVSIWETGSNQPTQTLETVAQGLNRTAEIGVQVASMSLGARRMAGPGAWTQCGTANTPVDITPVCIALDFAVSRDVLVFAAVGNDGSTSGYLVQFPANEPTVIPVAGLDRLGSQWNETAVVGSIPGPEVAARGLAALARDVPSTFYTGRVWNPGAETRCSDLPVAPAYIDDQLGLGYGRCTGTSMATPFVAGIGALLRSLDPLKNRGQIASAMRSTATNASAPNEQVGFGRPNPMDAVNLLLESTNRLTPLFAFWNETWGDRFYTVVPQMAAAATQDTMPWRDHIRDTAPYEPQGMTIAGYPQFPSWEGSKELGPAPRAQVWVFSSQRNPFNPSVELLPIYRLSYACYVFPPVWRPACASNSRHIDHAYTTSLDQAWNELIVGQGYVVDGIEGYLVPPTQPQPAGAVPMYRAHRNGDWALIPSTEAFSMTLQGYTVLFDNMGWAFPNVSGQRPTY